MTPTPRNKTVTVSAAANVALIKYWGKADAPGNQPATGSLSIGLDDLRTTTKLAYSSQREDVIHSDLNDQSKQRITRFFDHVRSEYELDRYFLVETENNFPTGAGLASSASGFAALAIAVNDLCHLQLANHDLSRLARTGSGSAARSIYDGYVEVIPTDDAYAEQVMSANAWPLSVIVAVTDAEQKSIGSTEAMKRTAATSGYYKAWVDTHLKDMADAKDALQHRDFEKLADASERSCLKMHATMLTSQPPILYWRAETIEIMHRVQALRSDGVGAFFTIDAGPQVKIVCTDDAKDAVTDALDVSGIQTLIQTRVGGAPRITRQ